MPELKFHCFRISSRITKQDTHMRSAISPRLRLQITLRYLSGPASFTILEDIFRVPKSTLSKLIPEVCDALWQELNRECIVIPQDQAGWLIKAQEFQEKWQYPFALAALDGKHVEVQAFQNSGKSLIRCNVVSSSSHLIYHHITNHNVAKC